MKKKPVHLDIILMLFLSFTPLWLYCQSDTIGSLIADPLIIYSFKQDFIRIPKGEFLMGSDERPDEQPVHRVRIESFDLATTEVTVCQFRSFIQATKYITDAEKAGSSFACCWRPKLGITWLNPGFLPGGNDPVVAVSWNDAVAYCRWLSVETGDEYRLPSEAEWEYACLAGGKVNHDLKLDTIAWYSENSSGRTHPVAGKKPNIWGLYDMLGNSWEWTNDIYHDNYVNAPSDGKPWITGGSEAQRGYLKAGEGRVLRGGSWGLSDTKHPVSYDLSITSRPVFGKDNSCNNSGFRIARSIAKNLSGQNSKIVSSTFSVDGILYQLVSIDPGKYIMGDTRGDRTILPVHQVIFKRPFAIGRTEVTVKQFKTFVDATGYVTDAEKKGACWDSDFRSKKVSIKQTGISWKNPGFSQTENDPVTCVSWNDAISFCIWLSDKSGRNIRLPSEAEWEYAGADSTGLYYKSYPEIAWYFDNSGFTTHPVAGKRPNPNGLYDVLGNVSEWMMDIWHPDYEGAPYDGSSRLGEPVNARVCRGGSFERETNEMSLRGRDWYDESEAVVGLGFRIVDAGPYPVIVPQK